MNGKAGYLQPALHIFNQKQTKPLNPNIFGCSA